MKKNYHTHTARCHHATGTDEEYVEAALRAGLETLGFSDHTFYIFPEGYPYHNYAMTPEEAPGYFDALLALREKYRGRIDIRIGLETEYFPRFFDRLIEEYGKYPLDYILLAPHLYPDFQDPTAFNSFKQTEDPERLRRYTDYTVEAIGTGLFSCVAHPDVIHFVGDDELMRAAARRIADAARQAGIPLELNLYGLSDGRHYPNPVFWSAVGDVPVIMGCDAHCPERIAVPSEITAGLRFADRFGLHLTEQMPEIPPRRL